jgi:amino-acid N-acetyltransferase
MREPSFSFAGVEDLDAVILLLQGCGLPHVDIQRHLSGLIIAKQGDRLVGTVALEPYAGTALLRSLAVIESHRNRGLGSELLSRIVAHARTKRIEDLFLLTTTAQDFFLKHGFEVVPRNEVPDEIAGTEEFRSLCPSTAACMRKRLR